MPFHIHLSIIDGIKIFAVVLIAGTFWRIAQIKLRGTPLGEAMAFAY